MSFCTKAGDISYSLVAETDSSGGRRPPGRSPGVGRTGWVSDLVGTVLIVDDEEDVLQSTKMVVEGLGYDALTLSEASELPEVAARAHPGVILQDLKMGELNVAGLVAALRSNPETAEIPLVFFSANANLAHTAARYEAWGVLNKPFQPAELAALLDRALGPPPRTRASAKGARRDLEDAFHDYWNLFAALSSYLEILTADDQLPAPERRAVEGIGDVLLKLEARTDRFRAQIRAQLPKTPPT